MVPHSEPSIELADDSPELTIQIAQRLLFDFLGNAPIRLGNPARDTRHRIRVPA